MFWKPHEKWVWLSQWAESTFVFNGTAYNCCEQFMMAMKAKLFQDSITLEKIMNCYDPKIMRELGRKVKDFDEKTWDVYKWGYVVMANFGKFSQNEGLKQKLMATDYEELVEGSPYDYIWGVGSQSKNKSEWRGQNLLGKALMVVREMLRNEC